jgi:hypothetical protein
LERWLDTDENDTKIKDIKENIKLLLYNSKNIVISNKDKRSIKGNKQKFIKVVKDGDSDSLDINDDF